MPIKIGVICQIFVLLSVAYPGFTHALQPNAPKLVITSQQAGILESGLGKSKKISAVIRQDSVKIEKLKPQVRIAKNNELVGVTSRELKNLRFAPWLVAEHEFELLPKVISASESGATMFTLGDILYASGLKDKRAGDKVAIIGKLDGITDPDTKEDLGLSVQINAIAVIRNPGIISRLELIYSRDYVSLGDRVIPPPVTDLVYIKASTAKTIVTGKIIAIYDKPILAGGTSTVAINKGLRDGAMVGTIFDIIKPQVITNPDLKPFESEYLLLPEVIGKVLIYKVYDKMSFGAIIDSVKPVAINFSVQSR